METRFRSILKAISWRAGGTMVTFAIAWILTRRFELSAQIGILDLVIKVGILSPRTVMESDKFR